jgi:hypothetical protein
MNMNFVWPVWFISYVATGIASFGFLEAYALRTGGVTLSRFVWQLTAVQPWIIVGIVGLLCFVSGVLFCHFFWGGIVPFAPVSKP